MGLGWVGLAHIRRIRINDLALCGAVIRGTTLAPDTPVCPDCARELIKIASERGRHGGYSHPDSPHYDHTVSA